VEITTDTDHEAVSASTGMRPACCKMAIGSGESQRLYVKFLTFKDPGYFYRNLAIISNKTSIGDLNSTGEPRFVTNILTRDLFTL
jgi:hypothetical protein